MKIAVSSNGKNLDSQIDPRFGRCAYFLIVETDDMNFEAFKNDNLTLVGGAGIQSAQFVASRGAKAVITGSCGPNAAQVLSAAGIEIFVGQNGGVRDAVERYKKGDMTSTTRANVADHYGMGGGYGKGYGMGMGRGMGRRMGMGGVTGGSGPLSREEELNQLKNQVDELHNQIEVIESRIKDVEKK